MRTDLLRGIKRSRVESERAAMENLAMVSGNRAIWKSKACIELGRKERMR
jgi:hypothetical protein